MTIKPYKWVVGSLVFVLLTISASAQNGFGGRVDRYIHVEMKKEHIPGLSLAVIKDGRVLLAKGYGLANVELNVPVKPETIFQSGSMGKQFTAMAIMMLVEEGKLQLHDSISKFLPEVPPGWKEITVRHLLTHTAGTTDYPDDFDFRRDYTEDELLKRAMDIPLIFAPGEKWNYSNVGYVVLGILIRRVTGMFYGDFLQQRIFRPLGMTKTRAISEADIVPNRAAGYTHVDGKLNNQSWVSPSLNTTADGALYFNVIDLARWDAALFTEKLVSKSTLDQIWTPVRLNSGLTHPYGFGWSINQMDGRRVVEHGGAWQGFKSYISREVDKRLTVVVLANLAQANPARIAHRVAELYDGRPRFAEPK